MRQLITIMGWYKNKNKNKNKKNINKRALAWYKKMLRGAACSIKEMSMW